MSGERQLRKKYIHRRGIRRAAIERANERKAMDGARVEGYCIVCGKVFDYIPSGPGMIRLYCSIICMNKIRGANGIA